MSWFCTIILLGLVSQSYSFSLHNIADQWCERTPNPEPCRYFMRQNPKKLVPMGKEEFRKMSIELAMQRANVAHLHTKSLEPMCRNEKEKSAWADCVELYEEAIVHLNQTLNPNSKHSNLDVQTWLSAALTDLETCRTGFLDLGVGGHVLPQMSNNLTKLMSNSLSLSTAKERSLKVDDYRSGFPRWVTAGDRKLLQASSTKADIVVAQDGSGNYRTIKEAVEAAGKRKGTTRLVIRVRKGVYKENIQIGRKMKNIMLVGDGMQQTIITGSRSVGGGFTTFRSATVAVVGSGFIARDLTIRNTAGPQNHQAVALRSGSDLSVFYRCAFQGYQDTLYAHSQRQFYRECYIFGTVDFIFGNAAVVLQNCMIKVRRPMAKQKNTITAQGRSDPNQNTGISIQGSRVEAAADLQPVVGEFKSFLGRPWKQYSRTVFMKTYIGSLVDPSGWLEWSGNFALDTLFYGEYRNMGPGATTSSRVRWKGYRLITNAAEASKFTVANFISGRSWLPATGIPFSLDV